MSIVITATMMMLRKLSKRVKKVEAIKKRAPLSHKPSFLAASD